MDELGFTVEVGAMQPQREGCGSMSFPATTKQREGSPASDGATRRGRRTQYIENNFLKCLSIFFFK